MGCYIVIGIQLEFNNRINIFMGLSDRDYFRGGRRRNSNGNGISTMSVTMRIVIVNLFLWLANGLFFPDTNFLLEVLVMPAGVIFEPLYWYTFLTSGFVHSPFEFSHILLNMLGLLIFGYGLTIGSGVNGVGLMRTDNIEWRLGRSEYFCFYIFAIIFAAVCHGILTSQAGGYGASGGVVAVVIMFAFLYPNKTVFVMFIVPVPMWVLGIFIVGIDFLGAIGKMEAGIGYTAHLGGAFFALLYYFLMFKKKRSFTGLLGWPKKFAKQKTKSNLKIYKSDNNDYDTKSNDNLDDIEFAERLDQILDKYGSVGEAGLTKEEREFLQEASKRYRNKNK